MPNGTKPTRHVAKFGGARIVIAANNGEIGGGEVMLLNIARELRELGRDTAVLAPSNQGQPSQIAAAALAEGFEVIQLECDSRLTWMVAIRRWQRTNRRSVLWCNGLLPAVATALGANRIVHLHQKPVGLLAAAAVLAKLRALAVLVPSEYMKTVVSGARVLSNWVSDTGSNLPPRNVSSAQTLAVGFIGRLAPIKGIDVLAKAVALANGKGANLKLVVAGEARFTSDADGVRVAQALEALTPKVDFLGWVTPQEFLSKVDAVCCPSVWQEPFGLVVAEAMAGCKPILASRVGGIPEIVGQDYGYLVGPSDAEALAVRLSELAAEIRKGSPAVAESTERLRKRWQDRFSPAAGRATIAALLADLELR